tara:strand:- start:9320 stop:9661 length:342 start_codon:yes stop_codon:yes gene_type:complete
MALLIPLQGISSYVFTTSIEDFTYSFRVRWNTREGSWRLDIREVDGTPIVQGLKLAPNQNLTKGYKDSRLPEGNLYILDIDGLGSRPTFESLGDTQKLFYLTKEEEDDIRATV